jgi:hypothetical protein
MVSIGYDIKFKKIKPTHTVYNGLKFEYTLFKIWPEN